MLDHLPLSWRPDAFLLLLILLSALSLSLLRHFRRRARSTNLRQEPPSPWRLPLVGNLLQLGPLPHRSLRALSQKHGPVMLLHLGGYPTVVVSSAAAAEEVLHTNDLAFATRPDSSMADRLIYGSRDVTSSKYGNYWMQLRRISVTHLLSLRRVHSFRPIREEEVALVVERIRRASGPVNISELLVALTSGIICRAAFGRKYSEEKDGRSSTSRGGSGGFLELLSDLMELLGSFPVRDFVPSLGWMDRVSGLEERVRKTAVDLDAFLEVVLEEHGRKREGSGDKDDKYTMDFVDNLLSEASTLPSRESMKAIILDMFAAGTDTTYATIEWAMAELVNHPEKMKRTQAEIRRITGSKEKIEEETIEKMDYLKAVIKETLRLHFAVPLLVPHESTEDTQLQGFRIPRGTRLIVNAWAIARDPCSWEEAEEFRPERFMEERKSVDFKGQVDFRFTPFGAGRRRCPGMDFAQPVAELALANLLHHFDWELGNGNSKELDMSELYGLVVRKKSNLMLVPKTPN